MRETWSPSLNNFVKGYNFIAEKEVKKYCFPIQVYVLFKILFFTIKLFNYRMQGKLKTENYE